MDWFLRTEFWTTFLTLTGLEIVLGIDNVIFHALTISKLPVQFQRRARMAGMSLAVLMRFVLLGAIFWFIGISKSLFLISGHEISTRDLVLIGGGLFLVIKSCLELCHSDNECAEKKKQKVEPVKANIAKCIVQIVVLDIVFSLDSVITAVGMVNDMRAIMLAIIASVIVMMFCTNAVGEFLQARPRIRTIAFCFIALVGAVLVAEGLDLVVPKSHIYAAGAFALLIEYAISKCRKEVRFNRPLSSMRAKLHFGTVPAAPPPCDDLSCGNNAWSVGCNCQNPLSYGSCVDCHTGLGTVALELGKVDYTPSISLVR